MPTARRVPLDNTLPLRPLPANAFVAVVMLFDSLFTVALGVSVATVVYFFSAAGTTSILFGCPSTDFVSGAFSVLSTLKVCFAATSVLGVLATFLGACVLFVTLLERLALLFIEVLVPVTA